MPNIQINLRVSHQALAKIHQGLVLQQLEAPPSLAGLCRAGINAGIRLLCQGDVTPPPHQSMEYVEHLTVQVKKESYSDWRSTPQANTTSSKSCQPESYPTACLEHIQGEHKAAAGNLLAHLNEGASIQELYNTSPKHKEIMLQLQTALRKLGKELELPTEDTP